MRSGCGTVSTPDMRTVPKNSGQGEWLKRRYPSSVVGGLSATPIGDAAPVSVSFLKSDKALTLGDITPEAAFSVLIYNTFGTNLDIRRSRSTQTLPLPLHSCGINDLSDLASMTIAMPVEMIRIYMPTIALEHASRGAVREKPIQLTPAQGVQDEIISNLGAVAAGIFRQPDPAPQLLIDHTTLAFQVHLLNHYSGDPPVFSPIRGGLAGWQLRRVQDLLMSRLDQDISLVELADVCDLSTRHFSRAFRQSTGLAPFQWLAAKRLEIASQMVFCSSMQLGEIANACGYADQSHLGRVFKRRYGSSPNEERRRNQVFFRYRAS